MAGDGVGALDAADRVTVGHAGAAHATAAETVVEPEVVMARVRPESEIAMTGAAVTTVVVVRDPTDGRDATTEVDRRVGATSSPRSGARTSMSP